MKLNRQFAFTLVELMLALAVLGIIAAFTIPKLLQDTRRNDTQSKLKEAMSILESAWYNLKLGNKYIAGESLYQNLKTGGLDKSLAINDATDSTDHVATGGCSVEPPGSNLDVGGYFQFQDGLVVAGLGEGAIPNDLSTSDSTQYAILNNVICIDVNGAQGPNVPGSDVFYGDFNPTGDFDGVSGPKFTANMNSKNFWWGDQGDTLYAYDGTAMNTLSTVNKFIMSSSQ